MKEVKVSCFECGSGNFIDLDAYLTDEYIGLMHRCFVCDTVFGFDVEVNYLSRSFDPTP